MSRLHEHCPGLSAAEQEWLRRQLLKRAALTFERAGATSEAADCLRRLGATNAAADLLSRAGDLAAAAQTLVEGQRYAEACVCFRVWEERLDASDLVGRTRALLGQAACHLLSGERSESRAVYQRARATLMAAVGGVMEAACWAALAEYGTRVGRFDLIHEGYERALLLGHPPTTLARAYHAAVQACGDRLLAARLEEDFNLDVNRPDGCPICGAPVASVEWGRVALCVTCEEQARACEQPFPGLLVVRQLGHERSPLFLALSATDGSAVVVKTTAPDASPVRRARLLREIEILRRLQHPNVLRLKEVGQRGENVYFTTPYFPRGDLHELLTREGRLSVARAVRLLVQALEGLEHVHERGFVHMDVKPGNLLLQHSENGDRAVLCDFNISHATGETILPSSPAEKLLHDVDNPPSSRTASGWRGTPGFMPPEQITQPYRHIQPVADQYAAVVTLYYLLTGQFPVAGNRPIDLCMATVSAEAVSIRSRRPDVPELLAAVIHRGLAKDPNQRFHDVRAMREALLPYAAQQYDVAPPPPPDEEPSLTRNRIPSTQVTGPAPISPVRGPLFYNLQAVEGPFSATACPACRRPDTLGRESWPPIVCASCLDRAGQDTQPFPGHLLLARFGSSGTKYLAWEQTGGTPVVLSTVPEYSYNSRIIERQRRYVDILRRLNHRGFLSIRTVGDIGGRFYFSTDLVSGPNAARILTESGPLTLQRVVGWMLQILDALGHLHGLGYIHRNVSPDNLLIARTGGPEVVYLTGLDLMHPPGIPVEHEEERAEVVFGNPHFLSPEAIQGNPVGPAVDQYAAAVTLYNLLSANFPYSGSPLIQLIMHILTVAPKPLSELRPDLPARLVAAIQRAMHKDPQQRFRDVLEFRDALRPFA